jgi:release factor glutamine methyltransferase
MEAMEFWNGRVMVKQAIKGCVCSNIPTVGSCFEYAVEQLEAGRILESRSKVEWILGRVLQCRRLELPLQQDRELNGVQLRRIASLVRRVAVGEPLQYVLGDTEFMGRVFKTDSRALIPRPETEILVENALICQDAWSLQHPVVADVGAGTGCIIVSLALAHPEGDFLAVDTSAEALELSLDNARAFWVEEKIRFMRGDLLVGVPSRSLNLIVSNLPYVATDEMETLPPDIRNHEPRMALDGGPDGFSVITRLVPQAFHSLRPGGWLFLEIGEDQGERARNLMRNHGFDRVEIRKDLSGHDRIACGKKRERKSEKKP